MNWHAGHLQFALARYFDWSQNRIMPEFEIDGGIADMVVLSKSGYLTEIEIKVSVRDWRADATKAKWRRERPHIARFFYAIPETLLDKIPDDLPEKAGILVVGRSPKDGSGWGFPDRCRELRPARRFKARKAPETTIRRLYEACYFRYWRHSQQRAFDLLAAERRQIEAQSIAQGTSAAMQSSSPSASITGGTAIMTTAPRA